MRLVRTLVLLSAACLVSANVVGAECVNNFGPGAMLNDRYPFIFDGTVLALHDMSMIDGGTRPVATMEVHRVFKGQLPTRIEVRHWEPGFEYPDLEIGKRYVLAVGRFAYEVTHGPPDNRTWYETMRCGGTLRSTLQQDGTLDGFGLGWPPKG
jgi:hypothetical protein